MLKAILSRITQTIIVVFLLVTVCFFIVHALPGNPFTGEKALSDVVIQKMEQSFGLDKSKPEQLMLYWKNLLFTGDMGMSMNFKGTPVNTIISQSFPISLQLGLVAMVIGCGLGMPLGVIAALYKNKFPDYASMFIAMAGICLPTFVIGPLLQLYVAKPLPFLNIAGWMMPQDVLLPALTLGFGVAAYIARLMRGGMLEILNQDYIRTARAKGVTTANIIFKHALRPAIAPTITYLGPAFAAVITGSFVVETIFQIPGMGQHFVNSVLSKDIFLVMGLVFFFGLLMGIANLIVDIILLLLNPRLRS